MSWANSEVLPDGSVAVAETYWPGIEPASIGMLKVTLPFGSVSTLSEPIRSLPLTVTALTLGGTGKKLEEKIGVRIGIQRPVNGGDVPLLWANVRSG